MSVYAQFWDALEARDWGRLGAPVADDVIGTWPQSREKVRGRDALVRFMAAYPGDWHIAAEEEHTDAGGGATRVAFSLDGETVPGLTFFASDSTGRIASFVEFWPEPYEPPPGREHLLERY
ncbi:MAG: nuclear transport factor 2 family protein [Geodermatophilaceae bacterium]